MARRSPRSSNGGQPDSPRRAGVLTSLAFVDAASGAVRGRCRCIPRCRLHAAAPTGGSRSARRADGALKSSSASAPSRRRVAGACRGAIISPAPADVAALPCRPGWPHLPTWAQYLPGGEEVVVSATVCLDPGPGRTVVLDAASLRRLRAFPTAPRRDPRRWSGRPVAERPHAGAGRGPHGGTRTLSTSARTRRPRPGRRPRPRSGLFARRGRCSSPGSATTATLSSGERHPASPGAARRPFRPSSLDRRSPETGGFSSRLRLDGFVIAWDLAGASTPRPAIRLGAVEVPSARASSPERRSPDGRVLYRSLRADASPLWA